MLRNFQSAGGCSQVTAMGSWKDPEAGEHICPGRLGFMPGKKSGAGTSQERWGREQWEELAGLGGVVLVKTRK